MNNDDFSKCAVFEISGDELSINCVKGLWGVDDPRGFEVENEARHYWQQYASAGEYSDIIGGPTVLEVLNIHLQRNRNIG